jgi:hypothetical protein
MRCVLLGASGGEGETEPPADPLTVTGFGQSPPTTSSATSRTVTFNGVAGELLIAIAGVSTGRNLQDLDGSWTVVQAQLAHNATSTLRLRVWRKILSGTQASQDFTIDSTAVAQFVACVIRVGGDFDSTTPIDVIGFDADHASGTTVTCPAVTTTKSSVLLIRGFIRHTSQNNGDSNYPGSTTGLFVRPSDNQTASSAIGAAWHVQAGAGGSGTAAFTDVGTISRACFPFTIGIRPV